MDSRFIITATPELRKSAMQEVAQVAPDARIARELKDGAYLIETEMPRREFTETLVQLDPIFVRHLMPVQEEMGLSNRRERDFPALVRVLDHLPCPAPGERFAVQCRRVGTMYDYAAKDVEVLLGREWEARGAVACFSDYTVEADESLAILSVYLFEERGYLGVSTVRENLNEHSNEYRIFARHATEVSRAEFKLIEALRKFRIALQGGRALDLGAAPGGWTKVLADRGLQVIAVDPAALDPRVAALPNVTHFKGKAEDYQGDADLNLLVCDMNVEPEQAAAILIRMARHLKAGAYAILTVKLVIRHPDKLLGNIRPVLAQEYDILRIKNLFHNRQEVTMLLRKK